MPRITWLKNGMDVSAQMSKQLSLLGKNRPQCLCCSHQVQADTLLPDGNERLVLFLSQICWSEQMSPQTALLSELPQFCGLSEGSDEGLSVGSQVTLSSFSCSGPLWVTVRDVGCPQPC